MEYCYHERIGSNHIGKHASCDPHGIISCTYVERGTDFLAQKIFEQENTKNFRKYISLLEDQEDMYIKEYTTYCGESTGCMTIQDNMSFDEIDKKFKKVLDKHDVEIYTNGTPIKIRCGQPFRFDEDSDDARIILCLVKMHVYLLICKYGDEYRFNQIFVGKLACISETSYTSNISKQFKKYLDKKTWKFPKRVFVKWCEQSHATTLYTSRRKAKLENENIDIIPEKKEDFPILGTFNYDLYTGRSYINTIEIDDDLSYLYFLGCREDKLCAFYVFMKEIYRTRFIKNKIGSEK